VEVLRIAEGDTKRTTLNPGLSAGVEVYRIAEGDTKRMQNELKTNTTGTVTTIHVQEGATVETGTILITVVAAEA
jgi:acetyl/propionyl-CoA carboxylase alpha subunit